MKWVTPSIGKLFSDNKEAYAYLNESVIAFPEGAAFLTILEQAGFKNVSQEKLSLGICSIYCASK
jgi:demethylmenaquinone methyltransferase/2-methoxy-6-polyprenyl-1,4-benzoquinol methylase